MYRDNMSTCVYFMFESYVSGTRTRQQGNSC